MRLKISLPTQTLVDEEVVKVVAEADDGMFCILPRHTGFVSALVPGVLYFFPPEGPERFAALDEGILVKCGREVLVSSPKGVSGGDLGGLKRQVEATFLKLDEAERKARTALARLEAGTLRGFLDLQERVRG